MIATYFPQLITLLITPYTQVSIGIEANDQFHIWSLGMSEINAIANGM